MIDWLPARLGKALPMLALAALALPLTGFAQDDGPGAAGDGDVPAEEGRLVVPLSGTATISRTGNLAASPTRLDSGLIEIGDYKTLGVTLSHTGAPGSDPLVLGAATLFGKDAAEYTSDFEGFRTLAPGESVEVGITFTPSTPGTKSAGLRIDIEGVTAPYVVLVDGRSRYPLTSDLGLSGAKLAFGQSLVGAPSTKRVVLSNLGASDGPPINVVTATLAGDTPDAFAVDFAPKTLYPGETLELAVTLQSGQAGTKAATLEIVHDGNNPAVTVALEGRVVNPVNVPVSFGVSELDTNGVALARGTSIQFGPDGKLYVAEMDGPIHVFAVTRKGKNDYAATRLETIDLIRSVPNHDDDGTPNPGLNKRLLTGIRVAGTAAAPVIYAASSDPRQGAGPSGADKNLDTNSGILHRLKKQGGTWTRQDLVRGLPRSEENHVANGLVLAGNTIFVNTGGHTNQGVPSNNFARLPEYALSSATLEIDLGQIGNATYDLPTLDDEDRPGVDDANDPFGGNNGKNQAKLVAGGPVQVFATGFRNAYDLVMTEAGRLYTFDNGPNSGWGGTPGADCSNAYRDGGNTYADNLHLVTRGSYAGHPNPTRGDTANTFNASNPQSPVEIASDPVECDYLAPGKDGSLTSINSSVNGIDEYVTGNFAGAMKGDLIAAAFNHRAVYRLQLDGGGTAVQSKEKLAENLPESPLDLTVQGAGGPFPGTIWIVANGASALISVLEPADY